MFSRVISIASSRLQRGVPIAIRNGHRTRSREASIGSSHLTVVVPAAMIVNVEDASFSELSSCSERDTPSSCRSNLY